MKDRASKKNITTLTALKGEILIDSKSVKREIVDFYKSLVGTADTTLPAVNMQILKNGPQLKHQQAVELAKDISKQEVDECMQAIGMMPKAINCTTVTLLPKITNPTNIKDYIPISCCSVLYKIISKILASRLQKVMGYLIDSAQVMEGLGFPHNFDQWVSSCIHSGDNQSVAMLKHCFDQFSTASGLKVNLNKSSVYFSGVCNMEQELILQQLGYVQGELPFRYLGVPLTTKKMRVKQWQPLIDKIVAKISSWTARKLSYAGRVQLIRTVVFGVQFYWSQIFLLPSKSAGGLNILNLKRWNKAAILKMQWDLATKADRLWFKWVHMYYIKGHPLANINVPKQASWMVQKIMTVAGPKPQLQGDKSKCSVIKQLYLQQLGSLAKVEWKATMFKNLARPKVMFAMWLIIQERMMTIDRLIKRNINVDPICIFCGIHPETHAHLFCECTVTTGLWAEIFNWLHIQMQIKTWDHLVSWFVEKTKKKFVEGQLLRLVLAETLYSIWTKRNHRIFDKVNRDSKSIIREIAYICNIQAVGKLKEVQQHKLL
ncbi:PREDICTED: uncharacterized protein LOC109218205 [Nicotiana attenuata]|uniref:uncharacterized protein LOC109218205 n=1 Tax=Nicotiana attenuata TaxID=49451 RepID=UPI00090467F8|nr:PREDICTED: uncharacterized protein LOC109218205 [Nicotiana attenuata]